MNESFNKFLARTIPSLFISDKDCPEIKLETIDSKVYFGCGLNITNSLGSAYEPCNCPNYKFCPIYNKKV